MKTTENKQSVAIKIFTYILMFCPTFFSFKAHTNLFIVIDNKLDELVKECPHGGYQGYKKLFRQRMRDYIEKNQDLLLQQGWSSIQITGT